MGWVQNSRTQKAMVLKAQEGMLRVCGVRLVAWSLGEAVRGIVCRVAGLWQGAL